MEIASLLRSAGLLLASCSNQCVVRVLHPSGMYSRSAVCIFSQSIGMPDLSVGTPSSPYGPVSHLF